MELAQKVYEALNCADITETIIKNNEEELSISLQLLDFVHNKLLNTLNGEIEKLTVISEIEANKANMFLFSQGIISYKSSLDLARNGYFTGAVIVARNLIETIINLKYIMLDNKRGIDYMQNPSKWTNTSVRDRAFETSDICLYSSLYNIFCDYSHSNYRGTNQTLNHENKFNVFPSNYKIDVTIKMLNELFYYLIRIICDKYSIDYATLKESNARCDIGANIESLERESGFIKFIIDTMKDVLTKNMRNEGVSESDIKKRIAVIIDKEIKSGLTNMLKDKFVKK